MARIYRNVHTAIWDDDKFPFCSDDCQLVWFHLKTSRYSTPVGFVLESLEGLTAHKNKNGAWPLERYQKAFTEGLAKGFWEVDEKHQIIFFSNWFEWNRPENPNVVKSYADWFTQIPSCKLKLKGLQELKALCKGLGEAFMKAFEEAFGKGVSKGMPNRERETERETERIKDKDGVRPKTAHHTLTEFEQAVEQIYSRWKDKFASPMNFTGRDGKFLKTLLTRFGLEETVRRWEFYLDNPDRYCQENGQSFANFFSVVDKVGSRMVGVQGKDTRFDNLKETG